VALVQAARTAIPRAAARTRTRESVGLECERSVKGDLEILARADWLGAGTHHEADDAFRRRLNAYVKLAEADRLEEAL
jgi:hypothetical protein